MGDTESAGGSAAIRQDHVHPVVGDGRDGVSGRFCNYPARSRTDCGSPMGVTESTSGFATIRQDHVQTVSRRWE
jgi:hypothetical protein